MPGKYQYREKPFGRDYNHCPLLTLYDVADSLIMNTSDALEKLV
jgi:hypothetical protein